MTTNKKTPDSTPALEVETALYLVVDLAGLDPSTLSDRLTITLNTLPLSAILLAHQDGASGNIDALRVMVANIQNHNIAALVSNDPKFAQVVGADGIHLHWRASITADYEATRALGGGTMMIGADAGKSRHDAMVLAERNADYVAFGVPSNLKDQETARARQLDLIKWWAELFEIPVVAFDITTPEQAAAAKAAGADFVAATLPPNSTDQAQFKAWLNAFADLFPTPRTYA